MRSGTALLLLLSAAAPARADLLHHVGMRIWQNECGGRREGLTSWNRGEAFPSLGIGHFLWYPAGRRGPFTESFPPLLAHLRRQGVELPDWLGPASPAPWRSRAAFRADLDSPRMESLRSLLAETVGHQARFILERMRASLPEMLREVPEPARRERIRARFRELAASPEGVFALADYVNFKGEGTNPRERYQGEGWGLLQVLEQVERTARSDCPVADFRRAARRVLSRRVENDPSGKDRRWLRGWLRRCDGYVRSLSPGSPPPCE